MIDVVAPGDAARQRRPVRFAAGALRHRDGAAAGVEGLMEPGVKWAQAQKDYDAPRFAGGFGGAFAGEERVSELPEESSQPHGSPLFAQNSLLTGWGDSTAVSEPEPEPEPEPRVRETVDPKLLLEQKRTANRLHDGTVGSVRPARARQQPTAPPAQPPSLSRVDRSGTQHGTDDSATIVGHASLYSHHEKRKKPQFTGRTELLSRAFGALGTIPMLRTATQLDDIATALDGSDLGTMLRKRDGIGAQRPAVESCRFLRFGSLGKGRTLCRKGSPAEAVFFTAIGNPQMVPPRETGPPGVRLVISLPLGSLVARVGAESGRRGVYLEGARCAAEDTSVILLTKKDFHQGNLKPCLTEAALEQLCTYWPQSETAHASSTEIARSERETSAGTAKEIHVMDAAAMPTELTNLNDAMGSTKVSNENGAQHGGKKTSPTPSLSLQQRNPGERKDKLNNQHQPAPPTEKRPAVLDAASGESSTAATVQPARIKHNTEDLQWIPSNVPSGDASEATDDWVMLKPLLLERAGSSITVLHDPRSGALYTFKEVMFQSQLARATLQPMQVAPGHLNHCGWVESMVEDGWRLQQRRIAPAHQVYSPRCVKLILHLPVLLA
eukprot:COSAG02_NODE_6170_length_3753_cov_8.278816_2_plen_610_part_00